MKLGGKYVEATEILAMRSPSYFVGDLRKLKLVSDTELVQRALGFHEPENLDIRLRRTGKERCDFFLNAQNVLICSTKGRPEADKMSGGDYDGDTAWTCWNPVLLDQVEVVEAEDTAGFVVEKDPKEQQLFHSTTIDDRLDFYYHYRLHQSHLGKAAEALDRAIDRFGFQHEFTRDLGRVAFLRVSGSLGMTGLRFLCRFCCGFSRMVSYTATCNHPSARSGGPSLHCPYR